MRVHAAQIAVSLAVGHGSASLTSSVVKSCVTCQLLSTATAAKEDVARVHAV